MNERRVVCCCGARIGCGVLWSGGCGLLAGMEACVLLFLCIGSLILGTGTGTETMVCETGMLWDDLTSLSYIHTGVGIFFYFYFSSKSMT